MGSGIAISTDHSIVKGLNLGGSFEVAALFTGAAHQRRNDKTGEVGRQENLSGLGVFTRASAHGKVRLGPNTTLKVEGTAEQSDAKVKVLASDGSTNEKSVRRSGASVMTTAAWEF